MIRADREQLAAVCGSSTWVDAVGAQQPFESLDALHAAADAAFDALTEQDWLEAFAHHPRIGDVDSLRERFAASGHFSEREQAGVAGADEALLEELARGNRAYEEHFGFVFLIRAAGRTIDEMRLAQVERIGNERAAEIQIAAAQQREITHLRIDQAFGG